MQRLEEIIYLLLEKGVVPSDRTIHVACVYGETRLLEDLLKRYHGPLVIEFTTPDLPPTKRLSTVVEVLYGFEIQISIRHRSGKVLSPLEYFIIEHAMGCWSNDWQIRQFIKDVVRICPPPNMDIVFDIYKAIGTPLRNLTRSYNMYEQVKMI